MRLKHENKLVLFLKLPLRDFPRPTCTKGREGCKIYIGWLCSFVDFSLDAVDVVYVDVRCKFDKYVFLWTYEGAFSDICV